MTAESAAKFFDELGAGSAKQNNQQNNNNNVEEQKVGDDQRDEDGQGRDRGQVFVTETISKNVNWDEGAEGIIKRNLLIGNMEYASEVALKAGRTAEALLIAEAGGQQLFDRIKEEYFA